MRGNFFRTPSGFDCHAYCAGKLDFGEEVVVEHFLAEQGLSSQVPRAEPIWRSCVMRLSSSARK
jgi:hypothetical protein